MKRREFLKWSAGSAALALSLVTTSAGSTTNPDIHPSRRISVVGVGGCGVRVIARMLDEFRPSRPVEGCTVGFFAVDTDHRSLIADTQKLDRNRHGLSRLSIHAKTPSCADPEMGRQIAWRHRKRLADELHLGNSSGLILLSGLGRGCGTGFSQMLAQQARRQGTRVVACTILPFSFSYSFCQIDQELVRLQQSAHVVQVFTHDETNQDAHLRDVMADCERDVIAYAVKLIELGMESAA